MRACVQHQMGAFTREVERDLTTDAATRTGDDRDAVAQAELHQPSARDALGVGHGEELDELPVGIPHEDPTPDVGVGEHVTPVLLDERARGRNVVDTE